MALADRSTGQPSPDSLSRLAAFRPATLYHRMRTQGFHSGIRTYKKRGHGAYTMESYTRSRHKAKPRSTPPSTPMRAWCLIVIIQQSLLYCQKKFYGPGPCRVKQLGTDYMSLLLLRCKSAAQLTEHCCLPPQVNSKAVLCHRTYRYPITCLMRCPDANARECDEPKAQHTYFVRTYIDIGIPSLNSCVARCYLSFAHHLFPSWPEIVILQEPRSRDPVGLLH